MILTIYERSGEIHPGYLLLAVVEYFSESEGQICTICGCINVLRSTSENGAGAVFMTRTRKNALAVPAAADAQAVQ